MTVFIKDFTKLGLSPQTLWSFQSPETWHPQRPIVSSKSTVMYGVAKELASIIRPLVGQSFSPYYKHPTLHGRDQIFKVAVRGMHGLL